MRRVNLAIVVGCLALGVTVGAAFGVTGARAEQSAIDRALVERLVRAVESQATATRELVRATERCKR